MKKNIGINDFNNFMSNDYSELKATMSKMTEQLDKGYSIFMKSIMDVIEKEFQKMVVNIDLKVDKNQLEETKKRLRTNAIYYGKAGWCINHESKALEKTGIMGVQWVNMFYELCEERDVLEIEEIDGYIMSIINDSVVEKIIEETYPFMSEDDINKLNCAKSEYDAEKYYQCAVLLVNIIDSLNIKKNRNNESSPVGNNKVDVGMGAMKRIAKKYCNNEYENIDNLYKDNGFETFIEENKDNMTNSVYNIPFVTFSFSFYNVFKRADFSKDKRDKGEIINRNLLCHGMYILEDIKKSDCVKLFLMLNQLVVLHKKYMK